jgi:hypothetical protein
VKRYIDILISRTGIMLLCGFALLLVPFSIAHLIGYLFIFTAFDVFGYRYVGRFITGKELRVPEYRVVQLTFQVLLTCIAVIVDGYYAAIAFTVAWLLLVCDVLYYYCVNERLTPFTWFIYSPINFIYNVLLKKPTSVWAVVASAIMGLLTGICLIIFGVK